MKHYLSERDYRVVCNLSDLGVSNAIIAQAFGVSKRTISRVISGKTNARRQCGGRKRSTSKQTDDYICLTVKKFHDMPLLTIQQHHLPDISFPVTYKRLKSFGFVSEKPIENHISMLDIGTYAFDLPKSSWIGLCLFGDQYTSLMSLFSRTLLPKNPKGWFVDLGSPNLIREGILNSFVFSTFGGWG